MEISMSCSNNTNRIEAQNKREAISKGKVDPPRDTPKQTSFEREEQTSMVGKSICRNESFKNYVYMASNYQVSN